MFRDPTDYSPHQGNATDPNEITYHRDGPYADPHPAINVKVWAIPGGFNATDAALEGIEDDVVDAAWDNVTQSFWDGASQIARDHHYTDVRPEGRSSGWLVPYYGGFVYPDMADPAERARFVAFRAEIVTMLADVPAMLHAEAEALAEMGEIVDNESEPCADCPGWYLTHNAHPGNPWGPFATRTEAEALHADLIKSFSDDYQITQGAAQ